jgi:hypothetical protein
VPASRFVVTSWRSRQTHQGIYCHHIPCYSHNLCGKTRKSKSTHVFILVVCYVPFILILLLYSPIPVLYIGEGEFLRSECDSLIKFFTHASQSYTILMAIILRNDSGFLIPVWWATDLILIDMNTNRYIIYDYIKSLEYFFLIISSSWKIG